MSEEVQQPIKLARMAAVLCVAPLVGLPLTVWSMMRAFDTLSASGIADPGALSHKIGEALFATAVGAVLAMVGFPLSLWCIFAKRQRSWWLVTASTFAGFMFAWILLHGTWIYFHPPANAH